MLRLTGKDGSYAAEAVGGFPAIERRQEKRMRRPIRRSLLVICVLLAVIAAWTFYPIALAYYPDRCTFPGVSPEEMAAIEAQVSERNLLEGFRRLEEQGVAQRPRMERVASAFSEIVDSQPSFPAQLAAVHTLMRQTGAVFYSVDRLPLYNSSRFRFSIVYALPAALYGPILPLPGQRWDAFQLIAEPQDGRVEIVRAGVGSIDWKSLSLFRGEYEGPCIRSEHFTD